jgi:hypothetical protein
VTFPLSGTGKLSLDQESFQKLLGAAYTLQENKNVLRAGSSENDSASVMSDIATLRSLILAPADAVGSKAVNPNSAEVKPKTAADAAALVANCLRRLTKADGASVCLIVDGYLRPTAYSGTIAKVPGGSVASNSLVATERLRNGRAFQSANACSDIRLGPSLCVDLQIGSLLAFPIERQNEIAGLIEVRWIQADAFSDGDERICQLMADLMSEVLGGEYGEVNASVTHPPQVTASPVAIAEMATSVAKCESQAQELSSTPVIADAQGASSDHICRVCGKPLKDDLNFCGSCGMLSAAPDNGMQGKWASMWFMQQAQKAVETEEGRGERLWPLHPVSPQKTSAPSPAGAVSLPESRSEDTETDENGETSPQRKLSPRGVLAVLKSRFRARAIGQ